MTYDWNEIKVGFAVNDGAASGMKVSKFIWAWRKGFYERAGWTVDGGVWPRIRVTRPARFDDFIYGDGASSSKFRGLAGLYRDGTRP